MNSILRVPGTDYSDLQGQAAACQNKVEEGRPLTHNKTPEKLQNQSQRYFVTSGTAAVKQGRKAAKS